MIHAFGKNPYDNVEKLYREEEDRNKQVQRALELFTRKILNDFSHQDFSFGDIVESHNAPREDNKYGTRTRGQAYRQKDFDYLVEQGLLIYDEDQKTYSVDHNSPDVARIIEEEEREK
jgi:hypothetical protein